MYSSTQYYYMAITSPQAASVLPPFSKFYPSNWLFHAMSMSLLVTDIDNQESKIRLEMKITHRFVWVIECTALCLQERRLILISIYRLFTCTSPEHPKRRFHHGTNRNRCQVRSISAWYHPIVGVLISRWIEPNRNKFWNASQHHPMM